jgi:hypothetical protein
MAIGRMTMSSELLEKSDKGKAVITLHTYGDSLWERGGKLEPPKEPTILLPEGQFSAPQATELTNDHATTDGTVDPSTEHEQALEEPGAEVTAEVQLSVQAQSESAAPEHSASGKAFGSYPLDNIA